MDSELSIVSGGDEVRLVDDIILVGLGVLLGVGEWTVSSICDDGGDCAVVVENSDDDVFVSEVEEAIAVRVTPFSEGVEDGGNNTDADVLEAIGGVERTGDGVGGVEAGVDASVGVAVGGELMAPTPAVVVRR